MKCASWTIYVLISILKFSKTHEKSLLYYGFFKLCELQGGTNLGYLEGESYS